MEANARMPAKILPRVIEKLCRRLNPKQILSALTAIDVEAKKERLSLNDDTERKRVWLVIIVASVC
jgi:hypothetical protein